jgi:hypothetical protein
MEGITRMSGEKRMLAMNTVRHPAAPTQADVALSNTIRTVVGASLYAGLWPHDRLVTGIRLTERMDAAEAARDGHDRIEAGRDLLALALMVVPDVARSILPPPLRRAA